MKLLFRADVAGRLDRWGPLIDDIVEEIDDARQGAVLDAARLAVKEGRANIASAGFPANWQLGFRSRFYANKGGDPAAVIYHRYGIASVFETGMVIAGRPLLWLPVGQQRRDLPAPKDFGRKLVSVNIAGKAPMLFDAFDRKRGPLYVGIKSADIRKRFDLYRIIAAAADRMQEFYEKRLKG